MRNSVFMVLVTLHLRDAIAMPRGSADQVSS
jgi:hypothetical protein